MSKTCTSCLTDKDISCFAKDSQKKDGLCSHCRVCRSSRSKEYYKLNKSTINKSSSLWHEDNKEYHNKINKENASKRPKGHWRDYYSKNKSDYAARSAKRRSRKLLATPAWFENKSIKGLYERARELCLEVDHIIPLQNNFVCGLHCIDNLQLLTKKDNRSKGNRFAIGGY